MVGKLCVCGFHEMFERVKSRQTGPRFSNCEGVFVAGGAVGTEVGAGDSLLKRGATEFSCFIDLRHKRSV